MTNPIIDQLVNDICDSYSIGPIGRRAIEEVIAQTRTEMVEKINKRISECKQPLGYSCEYCSALNDILELIQSLSKDV